MKLSFSRKGDFMELLLCTLLIKGGYEVFRNVGCDGPIDIVVVDRNSMQTLCIDCKSPIIATDGTLKGKQSKLTESQIAAGIICMTVWEGKIYYWSSSTDMLAKDFEGVVYA